MDATRLEQPAEFDGLLSRRPRCSHQDESRRRDAHVARELGTNLDLGPSAPLRRRPRQREQGGEAKLVEGDAAKRPTHGAVAQDLVAVQSGGEDDDRIGGLDSRRNGEPALERVGYRREGDHQEAGDADGPHDPAHARPDVGFRPTRIC